VGIDRCIDSRYPRQCKREIRLSVWVAMGSTILTVYMITLRVRGVYLFIGNWSCKYIISYNKLNPVENITVVLCSEKMWIIIYTTIITEYKIYFQEAPVTDICRLEWFNCRKSCPHLRCKFIQTINTGHTVGSVYNYGGVVVNTMYFIIVHTGNNYYEILWLCQIWYYQQWLFWVYLWKLRLSLG